MISHLLAVATQVSNGSTDATEVMFKGENMFESTCVRDAHVIFLLPKKWCFNEVEIHKKTEKATSTAHH